jgi:hypothetical protein
MSKPEDDINHFKIWETDPKELGDRTSYKLIDQFSELQGIPLKIEWLANPVRKVSKGNPHEIHDPKEVHLTGWKMEFKPKPKAAGKVTVINQLTSDDGEEWELGLPDYLLVPAAKTEKKISDDDFKKDYESKIDHYLCYKVKDGKKFHPDLTLEDQIDKIQGKPEKITDLKPKFLGVPVRKGDAKDYVHRDAHLAIYEIERDQRRPAVSVSYTTRDQFSTQKALNIKQSRYLAVPSEKIISDHKKGPGW